MALFGSKKNKEVAKPQEGKATSTPKLSASSRSLAHVIVRPRITEKASVNSEKNVYSFEVSSTSTKKTIESAVRELYNVTPIKIAIVPIPSKNVFVRGKWGVKKGGKKAYVYLKKGETIEFV